MFKYTIYLNDLKIRVILFLIALCDINSSQCSNILVIYTTRLRSHYKFVEPLLLQLADKGHSLTIYSPFLMQQSTETKQLRNIVETDISKCFPMKTNLNDLNIMINILDSPFKFVNAFAKMSHKMDEIIQCSPIMELYNNVSKNPKPFDLIITETFNEAMPFSMANKLRIPVVVTVPNTQTPWNQRRTASPANPSYVKSFWLNSVNPFTFEERLENTLLYLYTNFIEIWYVESAYNVLMQNLTRNSAPPFDDIAKNTSLLLINAHYSINDPVPLPPNVIPVGGMHISAAKPIPKDIEKFINESTHGVVYFCMGSILKSTSLTLEKQNAFVRAFSKIPQRVLWKWEGDLQEKSDNILTLPWMPQRDILAHPNVKLFISHGGLLGTSEAIYEAVPILGIPIFGDQFPNMQIIKDRGHGDFMKYNEITEELVLEKINKLLGDPKYKKKAAEVSFRYRDRPMSPLDEAVYWTEYVIRHKGAHHLKTAAVNMPWYQYLLLDVIAFLLLLALFIGVIIYYSLKFTIRSLYAVIWKKKYVGERSNKEKTK